MIFSRKNPPPPPAKLDCISGLSQKKKKKKPEFFLNIPKHPKIPKHYQELLIKQNPVFPEKI